MLMNIISRSRATWSPLSVIRAFGLVLIICAAVILVTAGFAVEQLSPAMGVLGAIAGYLLGSTEPASRLPPRPEGGGAAAQDQG
jgi:hypothetical protein